MVTGSGITYCSSVNLSSAISRKLGSRKRCRLASNLLRCLMLAEVARCRQRLKEDGLRLRLITLITSDSERPVCCSISSKVTRSAQAAQMTQSLLSLPGSGFFVLVKGRWVSLRFMFITDLGVTIISALFFFRTYRRSHLLQLSTSNFRDIVYWG